MSERLENQKMQTLFSNKTDFESQPKEYPINYTESE